MPTAKAAFAIEKAVDRKPLHDGLQPGDWQTHHQNVLSKAPAKVKEKLAFAQQKLDISRTKKYIVATWPRTRYALYAQPDVQLAAAHRYRYRLVIETYTIPRIGKIKLKKLTSRDLQKLHKDLLEHGRVNQRSGRGNHSLNNTTMRNIYLMLYSAFERAVKARLIAKNSTDDYIVPKV